MLKTIPRPPEYIREDKFMNSLYKEVCKDLKERQLLYKTTLPLIHSYCLAYWNYHTIEQKILDPSEKRYALLYVDHNKQLRQHPCTRVSKMYFEQVAKYSAILGVNPYARSRTKQVDVSKAKSRSLNSLARGLNAAG